MSEGLTLSQLAEKNALQVTENADLQQKLDAMGHECGKMLGLLNDICRYHEECTHGDMMHALIPLEYVSAINTFVERDVDGENPFAATDAFLNEVRAEAVVNAAAHLGDMAAGKSASTGELIKSCGRALLAYAAQLRVGSAEGGV